MIRFACPHCQRVAETADALRGFTVICLGCRQPVRVPAESSVPDPAPTPAPPRPAATSFLPPPPPAPPPVERVLVEPPPMPPKPVVVPPTSVPAAVHKPAAAPRPIVLPAAPKTSSRRLLLLVGLAAALLVLIVVAGTVGRRWHQERRERQQTQQEQERVAALKDRIRDNFTPAMLKRLSDKVPKWQIAPTDKPKLKGKAVVLSVTDIGAKKGSFWNELLASFPLELAEPIDEESIRDLLTRGTVDELTFELSDLRWAEGIGEVDTIIGVRWRKEVAGIYVDGKLVEAGERLLGQANVRDLPQAQRWRATVVVLDRASARLTAQRDFTGPLPTAKPTEKKKEASGLKPFGDVAQWLLSSP